MTDQDTFPFVGEALAFDFVNTEIAVRRKRVDLIETPADLLAWWDAALIQYQMVVPMRLDAVQDSFARAKALRSALRRLFTAVVEQSEPVEADLAVLNAVLGAGHPRLIVAENGRFGIDQVSSETHAMLLTIAHSATWLLTECDRERLHKCRNEQCVLMFLDTTKNGNRIWCSTDCMNRARSRENYRQTKGT